MPNINPNSNVPQYNAGTDGRMRISALNNLGVSDDGTLIGTKAPIVSITNWKYARKLSERPSTVTAESASEPITGVVDETHLRRGGIRTTEFSGTCLVLLNSSQRVTELFPPGSECFADFIFDKFSTLGHHNCLITIQTFEVTGLNVKGETECSWTAKLNGSLPSVSAGA